MSEAGASLIVSAVSSPQHRVEVSEFLKSRMGTDHDSDAKQTGSDALFKKVGAVCVALTETLTEVGEVCLFLYDGGYVLPYSLNRWVIRW